ncbi:YncE family protein [Iodidimonas nitroreducens]|nr:YncE family protein [Iodidimonas nitroreducens]
MLQIKWRMRMISGAILVLLGSLLAAGHPSSAQTLVVGNKSADTVSFIDLKTGIIKATRASGHGPHEVAISPDGAMAAVVAYGSAARPGHTVSLYDVPTATALKVIDLTPHSRPHGLAFSADGSRLLITTEGSGALIVVNIESGKVVQSIETGQQVSHMLAVSEDGTRAYVANIGSGSYCVIDLVAGTVVRTVLSGPESEGIALGPDENELWVSSRTDNSVSIFDTQTHEVLATIKTGRMPIRVAVHPDGRHAITTNARDGTISLIDYATRAVIKTIALQSAKGGETVPVTAIFSPDGQRLYVAMTNASEIAVIDAKSWQQIGRLPAGEGSDGLGWSPLSLKVDA